MSRTRLNQIYMWLVVLAGSAALLFSVREFHVSQLDVRFLLMALATVLVGPRLSIQIPRVRAHVSVSDTFIFLTLLLFGGEAAIILATVEAICSSVRISKQVSTHFFNASATAVSTFLTVWALRLIFGETVTGQDSYSTNHLAAISAMAIIQYASNSLLVATALRSNPRLRSGRHGERASCGLRLRISPARRPPRSLLASSRRLAFSRLSQRFRSSRSFTSLT